MTVWGADADELDRLAAAFARAADELDHDAGTLTRVLDGISWLGDSATRFLGTWSGSRLPQIGLSTRFLREASVSLARNAAEQRRVSREDSPTRPIVGPAAVGIREVVSGRETKSGAVVRGVDGSEVRLREMSDGTYQVVITLASGMTVDLGDAAQLAAVYRGKFFTEGGVEWDFDASVMKEGSRTYTFSDPVDARVFFEALVAKQGPIGMTWYDVRRVSGEVDRQLRGDVVWSGYAGATQVSAEGSFGIRVGDAEGSAASSIQISRAEGFAADTIYSDGSTGEMSTLTGQVAAHGDVSVGPVTLDGSAVAEYGRQVELVRDPSGVATRLEVREEFTGSGQVKSGVEFLGTGMSGSAGDIARVESVRVFDLTDPQVNAQFTAGSDPDSLFKWASDHSSLSGQTISTHSGTSSDSDFSLLFSGEWGSSQESSTLTGSSYRAPGKTQFDPVMGDMRPQDGLHSQVVRDPTGTPTVLWLPEY